MILYEPRCSSMSAWMTSFSRMEGSQCRLDMGPTSGLAQSTPATVRRRKHPSRSPSRGIEGYQRGHEVWTWNLISSVQGSNSRGYEAVLCHLASSMLPRLLATIVLRHLFSVVLTQGVSPRSPPNSASACIPSSSSDATSRTSGSSGSGDTAFRFTLHVADDVSLGLEEEDGGLDSKGAGSGGGLSGASVGFPEAIRPLCCREAGFFFCFG